MKIQRFTLQEINALGQDNFVAALGQLFEGPPWIVAEAWQARPFSALASLYGVLCTIMYKASSEQQLALLRSHPDLVGKAALAGTLSPASTQEQASVGLDHLSAEEIATFSCFNQSYHDRFHFPFILCVREQQKKEAILAGFATRLHNSREQEIGTALGEVAKICWFRLHDLALES